MTIIVTGLNDWKAGNAYVGYDNLVANATITPSSEEAGFDADNLKDWKTYKKWKATSAADQTLTLDFGGQKPFDSFGFHKHNLAGSQLKLEGSNDGESFTLISGPFSMSANKTVFKKFDDQMYRYVRFTITGPSAAPIMAVLYVGVALQLYGGMEPGFTPPALGRNNEVMNSVSEGGELLGRSRIRRGAKSGWRLSYVEAMWVRTHYDPFIEHAEVEPWLFAWDLDSWPDEAAYCFTDTDRLPPPKYGDSGLYMDLRLDFTARTE